MPASRPFLTAEWRDLVLVTYRVPADLLLPHVPPGSELDCPDDAPGTHLLSLVAFAFSRTRIHGWPGPGGRHFPEFNARFYVRRGADRATVFLRELVPSPLIVLGARLLYNQPYALAQLRRRVERDEREIRVRTDVQRGAAGWAARKVPALGAFRAGQGAGISDRKKPRSSVPTSSGGPGLRKLRVCGSRIMVLAPLLGPSVVRPGVGGPGSDACARPLR